VVVLREGGGAREAFCSNLEVLVSVLAIFGLKSAAVSSAFRFGGTWLGVGLRDGGFDLAVEGSGCERGGAG
jgi:hypothetical protein